MKTALLRILELFFSDGRRETDSNSYCICGALKPEATRTSGSAQRPEMKKASPAN
jgi:hypothetical protein